MMLERLLTHHQNSNHFDVVAGVRTQAPGWESDGSVPMDMGTHK